MIHTAIFDSNKESSFIFFKIKEVALIINIGACMWKLRMNEMLLPEKATQCQKKIKTDESIVRRQCHHLWS
jgi:hypothetical protein